MGVRISVITAVFNSAATLGDALDSVQAQTWPDVEHVVVDGGSTDGSLEILHAHRERIDVLHSGPDHGIYDALNKGLALASGDVVGFLHTDDAFAAPDVLERIARAFDDPRVDAVFGDLVYVRRQDPSRVVRYWRAGPFKRPALKRGWMPPHPTFYARRSLYQRLGGFDLQFRIAADYESMLRVLGDPSVGVAYIPDVLVRMRLGGASNGKLANVLRKTREDYRAARRHGVGGLRAVLLKNLTKVPQFVLRASAGRR